MSRLIFKPSASRLKEAEVTDLRELGFSLLSVFDQQLQAKENLKLCDSYIQILVSASISS
jgi:hypothetical protein